jgi:hypothetical protein
MPAATIPPLRRSGSLPALTRQAAVAALVGFHAVLLWQRCGDATILDPAVLAKYAGALLLLVSALAFRRFAPVRFQGRRSLLVFWLVAVLLHLAGPPPGGPGEVDGGIAAIVELGLSLPLVLAIFVSAGGRARLLREVRVAMRRAFVAIPGLENLQLVPRAPPCMR